MDSGFTQLAGEPHNAKPDHPIRFFVQPVKEPFNGWFRLPEQRDGDPLLIHTLTFFQRQVDELADGLGGKQLSTRFAAAVHVKVRRLGNDLLELRGNLQDKFKIYSQRSLLAEHAKTLGDGLMPLRGANVSLH